MELTPNQTHSRIDTGWIENLALDEINMQESGVVHLNDHLNPEFHLEEASITLMDQIRQKFEIFVSKFNEFRGEGDQGNQIKIFKISNTVNDFMLYRNSLKLICARKANDCISIGFLSPSGGVYSAPLNKATPSQDMAHEIRAQLAPFNEITWRFEGQEVEVSSLVKHYLTEFIRQSAQ